MKKTDLIKNEMFNAEENLVKLGLFEYEYKKEYDEFICWKIKTDEDIRKLYFGEDNDVQSIILSDKKRCSLTYDLVKNNYNFSIEKLDIVPSLPPVKTYNLINTDTDILYEYIFYGRYIYSIKEDKNSGEKTVTHIIEPKENTNQKYELHYAKDGNLINGIYEINTKNGKKYTYDFNKYKKYKYYSNRGKTIEIDSFEEFVNSVYKRGISKSTLINLDIVYNSSNYNDLCRILPNIKANINNELNDIKDDLLLDSLKNAIENHIKPEEKNKEKVLNK